MDEAHDGQVTVKLVTKLPPEFHVPPTPLTLPSSTSRLGLSQLVNHLLGLEAPRPFDFVIDGQLLRTDLLQHLTKHAISAEATLEIEYCHVVLPPTPGPSIPHEDWIGAVQPLGDKGGCIVTGSYDGQVRIWDSELQIQSAFEAHEGPVKAVEVLRRGRPDGARLVMTAGKDQRMKMHIIDTSERVHGGDFCTEFEGHTGNVEAIASTSTGDLCCSGGWDKDVILWRAGPGILGDVDVEGNPSKAAKTGGAGKRSRSASAVGPERNLSAHTQVVSSLTWPRRSTVFSGSWDHSVRQWDVEAGRNVATFSSSTAVHAVACAEGGPASAAVAFGGSDCRLRLWDPRGGPGETLAVTPLSSHSGWISCLAWSPASDILLVSGSHDGALKLWDVRSAVPLATLERHDDKVLCASWLGDSRIASGGADCQLHVFQLQDSG